MSYWEIFITTICNIIPYLMRFTNKRWYSLKKAPMWVIFDDPESIFSNKDLEELGFLVRDYRWRHK